MQSFGKAGYKNKISQFVVGCLGETNDEVVDLGSIGALEKKYAIALQSAWRSRAAREYVSALKQEKNCISYRNAHPEILDNGAHVTSNCVTCHRGDDDAELKQKLDRMKFKEVEKLLFQGLARVTISDSGDNWNQRYQRIMAYPEGTAIDRANKYSQLSMLNHDFVTTAKTYAQTIISEYYLHTKDKSIRAKNMGGIAGGQKYLWRGILFKMSDGSTGPYNGSDEAAAKAAGHDLKGAIHYRNCGVCTLHLPLMALIDYKGFRMSAQAFLPLGNNSLVYGSADGGKTILKSNEEFNRAMEGAATGLNLCGHVVGRVGGLQLLHSAVDIEGHVGMDNRFYLLDMSRAFPPEAPSVTTHLDDILGDGTIVLIKLQDPRTQSFTYTKGTVHRAYPHGKCYDILFDDGSIARRFPSHLIQKKNLSIFWRLLRPEYVKDRGRACTPLRVADISTCSALTARAILTPDVSVADEMHAKYMRDIASKYGEVSMSPDRGGEKEAIQHGSFNVDETAEGAKASAFEGVAPHDSDKNGDGNGGKSDIAYDPFDDGPIASTRQDDELAYDSFESNNGDDPDGFVPTAAPCQESNALSPYGEFYTHEADGEKESDCVVTSSPLLAVKYQSSTDDFEEEEPPPPLPSAYGEFSQYDKANTAARYDEESPPHSDDEDTGSRYPSYHPNDFLADILPSGINAPSPPANPSLPPSPLSPDALSSFSNFDPAAADRNREVIRATERLVHEVIPAFAEELANMTPMQICDLDFSVCFHVRGINMRHMGLVRSHIPPSNTTSSVRTAMILQIVARTLKNITRDYQRRWMKSEQSTSEQGMHMLLTEVLNLVVGSNENSESFWTDKVIVGIIQRFGACSLDNGMDHIHKVRRRPQFLKALVVELLDMIGLHLKEKVFDQFLNVPNPFRFEFIIQDVAYLEPKVKCMHIVDFGIGIMLEEVADNREKQGKDQRTIGRMRALATEHFVGAEKMLPSHAPTIEHKTHVQGLI